MVRVLRRPGQPPRRHRPARTRGCRGHRGPDRRASPGGAGRADLGGHHLDAAAGQYRDLYLPARRPAPGGPARGRGGDRRLRDHRGPPGGRRVPGLPGPGHGRADGPGPAGRTERRRRHQPPAPAGAGPEGRGGPAGRPAGAGPPPARHDPVHADHGRLGCPGHVLAGARRAGLPRSGGAAQLARALRAGSAGPGGPAGPSRRGGRRSRPAAGFHDRSFRNENRARRGRRPDRGLHGRGAAQRGPARWDGRGRAPGPRRERAGRGGNHRPGAGVRRPVRAPLAARDLRIHLRPDGRDRRHGGDLRCPGRGYHGDLAVAQ